MLLCGVLVWFKKIWDYFKPANENDTSLTVPPENRFFKALYEFSFDVMTSAVWRTLIYLFVVMTLVVVSLLHLVKDNLIPVRITLKLICLCFQVECSEEYSSDDNDFDTRNYSSCIHAWVSEIMVVSQ